MSLRLSSSSTIRHHLRTLGSRIPHQWTTIALLLPVVVFLALYVVNERHSARIGSELEYERVVWPQYFGFPGWYGKPRGRDGPAEDQLREVWEEDSLPWNSLRKAQGAIKRPVRVLGLIPSNPLLHEQAVFLHHLASAGKDSGQLNVTLRESKELESENSECWDWVWTFEDILEPIWSPECNPIVIKEPDMSNRDLDLAREIRNHITLLTEANNHQIRSVLNLLYGDSFKYTSSPPPTPDAHQIALIHQSPPSADPFTFFPDRGMSGWKRKRVTLFLGLEMQKSLTDDLGRKEVIKDHLPRGWSVFFEKDPLQPSKWQSLTGQQSLTNWKGSISRRLASDQRIAKTMRHSGICVFEEEWSGQVLSHRMVQAMLSGCVVATITPPVYRKAISEFIIPLDPLKSLTTATESHHSIQGNLLPQLVQISGIISAYTPEELDEKALWAFMFAREKFTTQRKVVEVRDLVELWRAGGRGLQLPGGYSSVV